jgi:hypothetical protein
MSCEQRMTGAAHDHHQHQKPACRAETIDPAPPRGEGAAFDRAAADPDSAPPDLR